MSNKRQTEVFTCYMCDAPATTKEHAPPKCLFPEQKDLRQGQDLRKNLVKVSSCDIHNTEKSHDDEYLLYVLTGNLPVNATGQEHLAAKVMRAVKRSPVVLERMAKYQMPVFVRDESSEKMSQQLALKLEAKRIEDSLEHAARALYFHHFKEKLLQPLKVYTGFMLDLDTTDIQAAQKYNRMLEIIDESVTELLSSTDTVAHGDNPEVFRYWFHTDPLIIRLTFYDALNATLMSPPDEQAQVS